MTVSIPMEGNAWFLSNAGTNNIKPEDFKNFSWYTKTTVLRTYFWLKKAGTVHLGIKGKVGTGTSKLKATFQNESKEIEINNTTTKNIYIGSYNVASPGYYYLDLQGISRAEGQFAQIEDVMLGGTATTGGVYYSNTDFFYWGRRGPSVHLGYQKPDGASDIKWFYNEVTVPETNDVIGTYAMANGFAYGYFGIQVNSETERRVLFSVWSPFVTDNPNDIPEDQKVKLVSKGDNTTINAFGGEGSGGQSYMVFNWKVGKTYRFLLKGEPTSDNKTDFSAYFFDPEQSKWHFIACWRRPYTSSHLTSLYSFLENFSTQTGPLGRKVLYNNQWVCDTNGKWHEVTKAKFTADETARKNARLDYNGGYISGENGFYLKNCGFFTETPRLDEYFTRPSLGVAPDIDFSKLP